MAQELQAEVSNPKRPIGVTVICIISLIPVAITAQAAFSNPARAIAPWYPGLLAVSAVIGFVCTVGFWMMRKWAVYAYTALAIIQVILIATGLWNPRALIIPGIVIVVLFVYISRMQ